MRVTLIFLALISSCCPPGGVDKSRHIDTFPIQVVLSQKIKSTPDLIFVVSGRRLKAKSGFVWNSAIHPYRQASIVADSETPNVDTSKSKFEFHLDSSFTQQNEISTVILQINGQDYEYDYEELSIKPLSFPARPFLQQSSWLESIPCLFNNLLVPTAYALSCKASLDSKITYREGIILYLGLDS